MKHFNKGLTLILIFSLAAPISSLIVMEASCRDEPPPPDNSRVPVPAIPSFTLMIVDHSNDLPGYHVKNYTIDIRIKNQGYPAKIDGNSSVLKYTVAMKSANSSKFKSWTEYGSQSNSGYTTISVSTESIAPGGTMDIKVAAILGYYYQGYDFLYPVTLFASQMSGWSQVKSITLPEEGLTQTTPTPTNEPIIQESPLYAPYLLPLTIVTVVIVFGAGLFVYDFRKHKSF